LITLEHRTKQVCVYLVKQRSTAKNGCINREPKGLFIDYTMHTKDTTLAGCIWWKGSQCYKAFIKRTRPQGGRRPPGHCKNCTRIRTWTGKGRPPKHTALTGITHDKLVCYIAFIHAAHVIAHTMLNKCLWTILLVWNDQHS
jgi:hypothetical protein